MHNSLRPRVFGAAWINRTFEDIEAESIRAIGLRDALDYVIFEQARQQNAVVMSKDYDFIKLIEQHGHLRRSFGLRAEILLMPK